MRKRILGKLLVKKIWVFWALLSCVLLPHTVFAVGGADCQAAGGGCTNQGGALECSASGGTPKDQMDCPDASICCVKGAPVSLPTPQADQQNVSKPGGAAAVRLKLPDCIKSGDCTVDDIVTTGASFANLLTEISAALFFATFIYGGAMYVLSFGDKARVDKGKKAITGAAIGMALVLSAWTLVNYIAGSLTGRK